MAERTEGERIVALEASYQHVATKADIQAVKTDVANLRAEVKADIANLRAEVKADIESLRSELKTMRWLIIAGITAVGVVVQILNQSGG